MIREIIRAYVRHYRDNGQTTAYCEWVDHNGKAGRTETPVLSTNPKDTLTVCYGEHMGALFARAICHGIEIERETW